ncbi:MAG: hypothetical protein ACE3L7_32905 [Candidatus Pristimantibacillus sp.]
MSIHQFILEWYTADRDYVATYKDTVFRIHRDYKTLKKHSKTQEYFVYKLQQRKEKNNEYRDMGYEFYLPPLHDYADLGRNYSVEGKYWKDAHEIIDKSEEILLNNFFIEDEIEEREKEVIPPRIPSIAARMIVKQLKLNQLVDSLDEYEVRNIEDMLMRVIQVYRSYNFSDFINEEGKLDPIRLYEFELHLKMCMSEPTMYFIGGWPEFFDGQRQLHDEKWLLDLLEDEREVDESDEITESKDQEYPMFRTYNYEPPKARIPVSGYIYLVKIDKYNVYGFRKTTGDTVRDTLSANNGQKHQPEIVSYFKSDDVNRMFRFVKKQYEDKLVEVKEDGFFGSNLYDLDQDEILTITSTSFPEIIHEKLNLWDKEKDVSLKPGGYLMLFQDKNGAYLLRTTSQRSYQNLISRAHWVDSAKFVIGFLSNDIKKFLDYFHSNFKSYRDSSQHGLKERYLFDELDITQKIQTLSSNEQLQIVEVVTA